MANEFEGEDQAQKLNLNVDVEVKSSCERHVKIEVSREDVDRYFDQEYQTLTENASIPATAFTAQTHINQYRPQIRTVYTMNIQP